MNREALRDAFTALVDFGRVVSSTISSTTRSLVASLRGAEGSGEERVTNQQLWGHAAILWRPRVDTEVLFVRRGDELLTVASRETRWQVELSEGDVCIRNLDGDNPVRLTLRADGTCLLEANEIKLGDSGATEAIALGTTLKSHLDNLKTHLDAVQVDLGLVKAHSHAALGAASATLTTIGAATPPSVPDVESRHKVEN